LYDLIYNPEKTTFLAKGEVQGATILNGYPMLVLQAEAAWKIWNSEQ
jgi:shikimate dehydrogenase